MILLSFSVPDSLLHGAADSSRLWTTHADASTSPLLFSLFPPSFRPVLVPSPPTVFPSPHITAAVFRSGERDEVKDSSKELSKDSSKGS